MKSKMCFTLILIIAMAMMATNALALGIAPAQTYISSSQEPQEFRGIIVNNDLIDGSATLSSQLTNQAIIVEFSQTNFDLTSDQEEYFFSYTITLDQTQELNSQDRVGEIILTGMQNVGQVSAQLELTSPIYLNSESQTNTANTKFESEIIQEEDDAQETIAQNNAQNQDEKKGTFLESLLSKEKNPDNQIKETRNISPGRATIAILVALVIVITSIVTISFTRSKEL